MDLFYNDNWSLSFDVKKVWIDTEASLNGQRLGIINVNPWIYGLGVGYRFGGAKAAPVVAAAPPPPPPPPAPVAPPPPADSDHDGVIDANDRCPNTVAGAKVDANGCELDSDHDGVVDRLDKCPGTPAGAKVDATGCETVITLKGVNFETNSAKLTASSTSILDNAVTVLKQRSGAKVEVQGHTDSVGKDAYNLSLSSHRAKAVLDYLVAHGVDAKMLTSKGYGEAQPIASNDTAEGRAENRRVDLKFQ
jgi:OOP family OmpA-OmpF porin